MEQAVAHRPLRPWKVALLMAAFLLAHVAIWVLATSLSHSAPPWDDVEQLVWTQSLQWGYYKHPPAPTWWVWGWVQLLGRHFWVTYLAGQVGVAAALFCAWCVGTRVTTPERAFAAVVLTALVGYYGFGGIMANHNTLQLLPVAALVLALLAAVQAEAGPRARLLWMLVGATAALSLLSKYSALVWFAVLGLWLLLDPRMRSRRAWGGVVIAAAVFLALLLPHLIWLVANDFPTLHYAGDAVSGAHHSVVVPVGRWRNVATFLASQVGRLLVPLLVFVILLRALRQHVLTTPPQPLREQRFLWLVGLGPLLLVVALGLAGLSLSSAWATTFFLFSALALLRWLPPVAPRTLLRHALVAGLMAELLMASAFALVRGPLVDLAGRPARSNFPLEAVATELQRAWQADPRAPVAVVAGNTWLAGSMSVALPGMPLAYIDADPRKAPWVTPGILQRCDVAVLVMRGTKARPSAPAVHALLERADARGHLELPWTSRRGGPLVALDWGLVHAPQDNCPLPGAQ